MAASLSCGQQSPCSMAGSACDRKGHCVAAASRLMEVESTEYEPSGQDDMESCGLRGRRKERGEFEECVLSMPTRLERRSKVCRRFASDDQDREGLNGCTWSMPRVVAMRVASAETSLEHVRRLKAS